MIALLATAIALDSRRVVGTDRKIVRAGRETVDHIDADARVRHLDHAVQRGGAGPVIDAIAGEVGDRAAIAVGCWCRPGERCNAHAATTVRLATAAGQQCPGQHHRQYPFVRTILHHVHYGKPPAGRASYRAVGQLSRRPAEFRGLPYCLWSSDRSPLRLSYRR
jgi:hypothetical protein